MNQKKLRILACQIDIPETVTADERDDHLRKSARKVTDKLENSPTDLVVLPELSSISYSRAAFEALNELAEPLEGPSFRIWREVAHKYNVYVAFGFARHEDGNYFISTAVINPEGEMVGFYDKIHLAQYGASMEKEFFTRGNHLFIFNIGQFKLASIICYDIRIPELPRTLATDHQVDVILHCGAYYRDESFPTWHNFVKTRSIENQLYCLSLNRAGDNFGDSIFCLPWMDETKTPISFSTNEEQFLYVEVDPDVITRERENYSFLADRLPSYSLPIMPPRQKSLKTVQ